jgi:2-polyprenyl-3-methyl-5-hydroxy-6-metoxy-1,4-benzoquinol methylase
LKEFSPVDYAITVRHLRRRFRDATTVIEVGVGGGLYSEMLARQGHQLCLVDVSAKLLDAAVERLRACGLEKQVISVERVQVKLNELSGAQAEAWLDLIGKAETLMPDALGMADHFLYVGKKQ